MQVLSSAGLSREQVRFCNLSNYRPYANDFNILRGSYFLQQSQELLIQEIKSGKPNLIIALGAEPLEFLAGKKGINRYRGSLFHCPLDGLEDIKIFAAYHPSFVLRAQTNYPTFLVDIHKAISLSKDRLFPKQEWDIHINPSGIELHKWEERLIENGDSLASDIESVKGTTEIICVGYSPDPHTAIVFSADKAENLKVIANVNANSKVSKTFHFGTYDRLVLRRSGLDVVSAVFDTYQAAKILNPELPASLEYLNSVYTDIPYYKQEGRAELPGDVKVWAAREDRNKVYVYNAKDCIATKQIEIAQKLELTERNLWPYLNNAMEQMEMALDMSLRGLPIDMERKELFIKSLTLKWQKMQLGLDAICMQVFGINKGINVRSVPQVRKLLYETMKFPPRKKKGAKDLSADEDTIVSLMVLCEGEIEKLKTPAKKREWEIKRAILQGMINIREVRQLLATYALAKVSEEDNRMRGVFVVNGTETSRWSGKKFVDDTGVNAQTFPRASVEIPEELINNPDFKFDPLEFISQLTEEDTVEEAESNEEAA